MNEYLNMWKNYANFSERTTVRGYWMAFLFHFIVNIIVLILAIVIFGPMVELTPTMTPFGRVYQVELGTSYYIFMLWALATALPMLAIQVRRLRDAGKRWTYLFINLIPFVGVILYIVALCKPSIPDDGVPVV